MATIPPPETMPELPPMEPGQGPDEISAPPPDIDIPDPGETEAHPS